MPRVPPVTRAVLPWRAHLPEDPIAVPEDSAAAISLLLLPAGLCAVAFLYSVDVGLIDGLIGSVQL